MESESRTVGEKLQQEIHIAECSAERTAALALELSAPAVQEIILARRHFEDANNRLKRAFNMLPKETK